MNIKLSKEHGVNPAIPLCFFCNEEKNEIILAGRMRGDVEAPKNMVWDNNPCTQCENWMEQGIIFISVKNGESGENPYRTGRICVIKEEATKRMIEEPLLSSVLKHRVAFIEDQTWELLGFPSGD